jgi:glycosyltransferase involved in cell wall biosynthesis
MASRLVYATANWQSVYTGRAHWIRALRANGWDVSLLVQDDPQFAPKPLHLELGPDFADMAVDKISLTRASFGRADLRVIREVARSFRRDGVQALLTSDVKMNLVASVAARLARVPRRVVVFNGIAQPLRNPDTASARSIRLTVLAYRLIVRCATDLVFQNDDDPALLLGRGVPVDSRRRWRTNGSGVDTQRLEPLPPVLEPPTFLLSGRVVQDKGVMEYCQAAASLKSRYPAARFQLAGAKENRSNPEYVWDRVEPFVDRGEIEYLGTFEEPRQVWSQAGVAVLPSYMEGTPRSLLEAMSHGRPVITTDATGCRETVIDGKTGYLVPVRDAQALADAMERFLREPDRIVTMGAESRQFVEDKFDARKVSEVIVNLLRA